MGPHDEIDPGAHGSYVLDNLITLGRVAVELAPPMAFAGIVIHELCHAYLGHEGDDGQDDEHTIQQREDEAVALACELGFREETAAYLDFFAQTFGDTGAMGRLPVVAIPLLTSEGR